MTCQKREGIMLNCHALLPCSRANGPGTRFVIWTQGCTRGCAGCFNPATHEHATRQLLSVAAVFKRIKAEGPSITGISISGGEPLEQAEAVCRLLRRLRRETTLSTLLFSGWSYEEIAADPIGAEILTLLDVLIAGPYDETQHLASSLLGSANQQIYLLTDRYTHAQFERVPPTEVHITADGEVIISGVHPQHFTVEQLRDE